MAMSKQDFVVLAKHINKMPTHAPALRTARESAARTVADACAEMAPRFDRQRFLQAALGE